MALLLKKMYTKREQKRYQRRADHAIDHRENDRLFVGVFHHHRQRSVFAGGPCGGDAAVVVQMLRDPRDHKKGKDLPHQVAEEGDASHLRARQISDRDAGEAVPAETAGDGGALIDRMAGQQRADQTAGDGSGDDARREDQDLHMIFTDLFQDPPVHADTDPHQKHQQI